MKKNIILLSVFTPLFVLSSCNFNFTYNVPQYPGDPSATSTSGGGGSDLSIDPTKNYSIKIWCDQRIGTLTQSQMGSFMAAYPQYKITFRIDNVGEDSAASQMIEDVPSGADLFVFAQDQLNRLKTAGALAPVTGQQLTEITSINSEASISAATLDSKVYAFPFTSDNGYFLMYDKSVVKESSLTNMVSVIQDCYDQGKKINYNIYGSGFYTASYFMSFNSDNQALCTNKWKINKKNKFYDYEDTYNSANGIIACKGLQQLKQFNNISNSDDPSKFGKNLGACVTGMWNYGYAKDAIGDNLGCAPMPSFTIDGKDYHIGSFSGYKLLGVKPQEDTNKVNLCKLIAQYLSGEKCQQQRFENVEWGPTNTTVSQLEEVINQPGLKALAEQNKYSSPQTACPSGWFDSVMSLCTSIQASDDDAALQAHLDQYIANINDLKEE